MSLSVKSAGQAQWRPFGEFENLYAQMDRLAQSVFGDLTAEHVQPVGAGDLVDAAADRGGIDELVNNAALSEELGPKKRVSLGPASYTFDTRARFLATPADEFEPAIAEQWENNKAQLRQQLAN